MRTREKSLSDYGVEAGKEKALLQKCREATREERQALLSLCIAAVPEGVETLIYESLVTGKSYDTLAKREYIPMGRDDFYGYRRKVMGMYYDTMRGKF